MLLGGRYALGEVLGEGGMSIVHAATDLAADGAPVAVKLLRTRRAEGPAISDRAARRLVREAGALRRMASPYAVRVLDVGEDAEAGTYVVMERLEGETLATTLAIEGPLPTQEAVRYVVQAADALAEAHALGVIHRDVKPANLFLVGDRKGSRSLKVIDFGIAKAGDDVAGDDALTATGTALGSPRYMAPEQVRNAKRVDGRADVWSLAVTLYELLSGKAPFEGTSAAALCAAIVADPPVPLRARVASAPVALERAISAALEKDPERRVPDVGSFVRSLRAWAPEDVTALIERVGSAGDATRAEPVSARAVGGDTLDELAESSDVVGSSGGPSAEGHEARQSSRRPRTWAAVVVAVVVAGFASLAAALMTRGDPNASHASNVTPSAHASNAVPSSNSVVLSTAPAPVGSTSSVDVEYRSTSPAPSSRAEGGVATRPAREVGGVSPAGGPSASPRALDSAPATARPVTPPPATAGPLDDRK